MSMDEKVVFWSRCVARELRMTIKAIESGGMTVQRSSSIICRVEVEGCGARHHNRGDGAGVGRVVPRGRRCSERR
jgi:hypothetical protein